MVGLIETGSHSLLEDIAAVAVRQSPAAKCQVTRTHETGEHHNVKYLRGSISKAMFVSWSEAFLGQRTG
ncbi:uncharacterized protein LACBIDRAFT_307947 [Laccaria bicolor S238N-H82]|uniref:Predicted protein n=1 Tax=Laccaria bicolor (strain S238N-H82 / ATCC MYA-4686) TaxID=486041 RepID=B0DR98_LACBS|nr:uncharacterized protein LACBIDRAFT_307947 [Laccaria bicolor S238N-H82]EDR02746.1 predicted protein [Laccaria bicolor S238N-H82]|eukprot:XP_001886456.1 predicted protein [Laccaria bicolor S238N-H82]